MLYNTNRKNRMRTRFRLDSHNPLELLRVLLPGLTLLGFAVLSAAISTSAQQRVADDPTKSSVSLLDSTREQDGLSGPVRRVHTEMSRLSVNAGNVVEEPRMLLEVTTYDPQGKRIWNIYYPVNTGSFKGNQEFAYDEQGHVTEMTLRDETGRVLSREAYTYDFDKLGNWTKMTSSLVIFEAGKLIFEPFETTYRAISYYYDDSVAQIVKSSSSPAGQPVPAPTITVTENPTSTASKTASGETRGAPKQQPSTNSEGAVGSNPTIPPPNNNLRPDDSKVGTALDEESEARRNVEVTASREQAFQIPASPISPPSSTKPTVSGGVVNGKIVSLPKPVYPKEALVRGVFGKVVVEVTIDEQGRVIDARSLSGNPLLRSSAEYAARLARFGPTLLSGQPVKATRLVNYDFNRP